MHRKTSKVLSVYVIGARGIPDTQGGIEKFCSKLYPLLSEKQYSITILTIKKYTTHQLSLWNGLNIRAISSVNNNKLEKLIYNLFATIFCLYKRPDIVHIHSISSGTFIFVLRLFGIKVMCRYNSQDYKYPKWGMIARLILKFGEYNFFLSNYVICNSKEYMRVFQTKLPSGKLSFIPNGIEFEEENIKQSSFVIKGIELKPRSYILAVGRITPEKGFDVLIDAFQKIRKKENISLVIAGEFNINDPYTNKIYKEHDVRKIIFSGYLTQGQLKVLYSNCALYVSTSRFEGMSNSVLEAIGYGCKILLSNIPGNTQLPLEKDSYFSSGDISELADKISLLINSSTVPDYSRLKNIYDWETIAEKIDRINRFHLL